MSLAGLVNAIRTVVSRGKVRASTVGSRTVLQVTGLDGEVKQNVELLLPPGYSARPGVGSDVMLLQVLGQRDHLVALAGDAIGDAIPDLADGEFGLRSGTRTIVFRAGHIEITDPVKVRLVTPLLEVTGAVVAHSDSASVGLTTHTHIATPHPDAPS